MTQPYWCKACRSVGMAHCAHPSECGSMLNGKDAWLAWIDDLPLPDTFENAQNALQEYITAQAAEIKRLRAALMAIEGSRPSFASPWTHEIAADSYFACLDLHKAMARAALEGQA